MLIAYPKSGIAYCDELYRAVSELGVEPIAGEWAGRWLLRNVRRGDLVHIHWPSFLYYRAGKRWTTLISLARFIALLSLMRLRGARLAWTAHNLYPHDGGRGRWVHRVARGFVTRICEVIFVHGATAASLVRSEFEVDPRKLEQVPHGHWRDFYPDIPDRVEARRRIGLPQHATVYGFVGSCRPYKNLEALVSAFSCIDGDGRLLIAGEFSTPEYLRSVRAAAAPHAANRVELVPRVLGNDEIMTYVAALDVLVLPYRDILTSGGVMLGLSAGVPVVAPRIGGMSDVVTHKCGVLYDPNAPGALAEAMRKVRRQSFSRDEIIEHALTFDWKVSARKLIGVASRRSVTTKTAPLPAQAPATPDSSSER